MGQKSFVGASSSSSSSWPVRIGLRRRRADRLIGQTGEFALGGRARAILDALRGHRRSMARPAGRGAVCSTLSLKASPDDFRPRARAAKVVEQPAGPITARGGILKSRWPTANRPSTGPIHLAARSLISANFRSKQCRTGASLPLWRRACPVFRKIDRTHACALGKRAHSRS
ncbi:Hypothetical predicted protein [Olea europaea subsp. europaea]|uniref:Uncharacterized protein n=1 Tax=Olea europaea subsp. europaea TaxID=158383 RepID=A0A8S0VMP5_OLEEU|nr:Hypothetical predicted protein [Olea europaea subsp. europaea]